MNTDYQDIKSYKKENTGKEGIINNQKGLEHAKLMSGNIR
jgi:hypothetical protein